MFRLLPTEIPSLQFSVVQVVAITERAESHSLCGHGARVDCQKSREKWKVVKDRALDTKEGDGRTVYGVVKTCFLYTDWRKLERLPLNTLFPANALL